MTPQIAGNWALFLDLDGTLIDIAPSPRAVVIPPGLAETLTRLRAALDGALAIVSGRPFFEIDALLTPVKMSGGAEHGAVIRDAAGIEHHDTIPHIIPHVWRREVISATSRWAGVQVEEKSASIALHYRQAPERGDDVRRLAATLVERDPVRFELLPAKMAVEIRMRGATKGRVVTELMRAPPFIGRVPVFVGDDVTDQDGILAACALGGYGLKVDEAFEGAPSNVRAWLGEGLSALAGGTRP